MTEHTIAAGSLRALMEVAVAKGAATLEADAARDEVDAGAAGLAVSPHLGGEKEAGAPHGRP